jgi:hypothetical protein
VDEEKGWWEGEDSPEAEPSLEGERGGPEVEDPFQEDEGAVVNPVAFVLRTLAVLIMFYISIKLEYL